MSVLYKEERDREEDKAWLLRELGTAFIRGVSFKGDIARIVVRGEGGVEKETLISLPSKVYYKVEPNS